MPRTIITQVCPGHSLSSPWPKNRCSYSRKTKNQPSGELREQVKNINAELKSRLGQAEGDIKTLLGESKSELGVLKDKVNLLPTEVVNNINKSKRGKWIIKFFVGALVAIPSVIFQDQITDYYNKWLKGGIKHIDFSNKISSFKEQWICTDNITELDNVFKMQKSTIQKLSLIGIPGSGKTTLAKQYALYYEQEKKDQPEGIRTVFYGDMRDDENFEYSYKKFAEDLGVEVSANAPIEEIISEVNKKLVKRPDWLFIVDNLDSKDLKKYEKLQAFLPKRPEERSDFYPKWPEDLKAFIKNSLKGKILLVAQEDIDGVESFNMQAHLISEDEALKIFNLTLGKEHGAFNQASTSKRKLLRQLSYFPLAIKQSAIHFKYAKPTDSFDSLVDSYLTQLKSVIKMRTDGHKETVDASKLLEAMESWQKKEQQAGGSFFNDLLKLNKDKLTLLIKSREEGSSRILVDIGPLLEAMQLTSIKSDERQIKFNSSDSLMTSFIGELQDLILIGIEKTDLNLVEADKLLKAIYSLNIQECKQAKNESEFLFSIIPFLNPYFIHESLLRLWFEEEKKSKLFESVINLLENHSLISRVGQEGWEVHPYMQKLIEEAYKPEGNNKKVFKEFILFLEKNYKLDMRFVDSYNPKRGLVNQIEPLWKLAGEHSLQDELKYCFVHLYNVLGNYHLQSNNLLEAQKAFKKSLELAGVQPENDTAETICKLAEKHKKLPALCAQAIHYLGKFYFHEQDLTQAGNHFSKAFAIQEEVSSKSALYDNPNPFDIITFQRQGIGSLLLKGEKEDLVEAEGLYLKIFGEKKFVRPGEKRDEFNEWYCNLQLGRVYHKLAQATSDKVEKETYYYNAQQRLEKVDSRDKAAFEGALQMFKKDHLKAGEIFLILGKLYLDSNCPFANAEVAKSHFKSAFKAASNSLKNDWRICGKSKYYLAKLYLKEKNLKQALIALNESIYYYNKLGKGLTRIPPKEAEKAKRLKNWLVERMDPCCYSNSADCPAIFL
ncbi:ATP-binding protein [Neochlamydia sp. TUME1]|uniref:ATP-binding protein n=1 Tax=Neochlamydia sp. TUME1 TaxID=1478174 RepID=UPI00057E5147|nr:ATP-binding protein [Neochlamydia sp. TUME1]